MVLRIEDWGVHGGTPPIGDGKCGYAIETRGVADAWACRIVTGVSRTGEVASDEWLVAIRK